jgi:hypothetical protein
MHLDEAISQIAEIRGRLARTQVFRGYRAIPVAASAVFAVVGGGVQAVWLDNPREQLTEYLAIWLVVALASMLAAGIGIAARIRHADSSLVRHTTLMAIELFLPCLVAGALVTFVIAEYMPENAELLPGLWSIFFSLGIFASFRLLTRPVFIVGVWYLLAGVACLVWARGDAALSPWAMVGPFGVGQLLTAAILYWTLERRDGETQT